MRICVYCSSAERIDAAHLTLARDLGSAIAARGWDLVSGGGRVSMMGEVARAVRAGGRHTVGVIPLGLAAVESADEESDELLVVADMRARKAEMEARADAFIALPGGIGTLEELFEVWTARSLGMHGKPVIVLDPDGVFAPLARFVLDLAAQGFVRGSGLTSLTWTASIPEALTAAQGHPPA